MSRDHVLHKIRTALGRSEGQPAPPLPPPLIRLPKVSVEEKIAQFSKALTALNGKTYLAATPEDAVRYAGKVVDGRPAVASNSRVLRDCGIDSLSTVITGVTSRPQLRELCANAAVGISSADYALADTGSLVMFSSTEEARMISLLPPCHVAIVPRSRILSSLDELFTTVPLPADRSSSMVLITGPSRTADIEQFLVRGVHGPGEIHVVIV